MGVLANRNARITKIVEKRQAKDWDEEADPAPTRWQGEVEVSLTELITEVVKDGAVDQVKETRLLVPASELPVTPETGDVFTYDYRGIEGVVRKSQKVEDHTAVGFWRIRFWDA